MGRKELSREELLEYLEIAIEFEKQSYIQEHTIKGIEDCCRGLGRKKNIKKPTAPYIEEPEEVNQAIGVIGIAVALIIFSLLASDCLGSCTGFFSIVGIILGIFGAATLVIIKKKTNEDYYSLITEYEREKAEAEQAEKIEEAVAKRGLIKKHKYEEAKAEIEDLYKKTNKEKQEFYKVGVLDDVYWGDLPAICSFYQYLKSERCYSLKGHEGAYNMYETEKRLDKIVDNLEIVIEKLEQIEYNQRQLYVAITDGMDRMSNMLSGISEGIDKMGSTLNSIKEQGAVAAEYQRQAAASAKSMEWMASTNWLDRRM